MYKYYKDISWEAFKRTLTKGPLILTLFKFVAVFGGPAIIVGYNADNLWTQEGLRNNWFWLLIVGVLILSSFWLFEVLRVNHERVEIVSPNLIVEYKEGEPAFQQWVPSKDNRQYKLHRIRVFNDGEKITNNIKVVLEKIEPMPTSGINGIPMELHVMGRDSEQDRHIPIFSLDGNDEKFIDVVSIACRGCGPSYLLYPAGSYNQPTPFTIVDTENPKFYLGVFAEGRKCKLVTYELEPIGDQDTNFRHRFK